MTFFCPGFLSAVVSLPVCISGEFGVSGIYLRNAFGSTRIFRLIGLRMNTKLSVNMEKMLTICLVF